MNKTYKFSALWMMCLILINCLSFTACNNNDEDTNQYTGGVKLNVFGPSPVARGGELRFLGSGMNNVTAVCIPGCEDITDINVITDTEIRVIVPQTAEPGLLTLKTKQGDIITKTELTFTEPIDLEELTPIVIKPGEVITLKGEYLNLIAEVIFADNIIVVADDFISQSRQEIVLTVPEDAQTGKIIISDGAEIPNWIYSKTELQVILPSVAAIADLTAKKPGDIITIEGENLDLVKNVQMPNGDDVEFELKATSDKQNIEFILPEDMTDGAIVMIPASGVRIVIANIGMALPSEVIATPSIGLRADDVITLTGLNMELITDITFPGVAEAVAPVSQSPTNVTVNMPASAISGNLLLNTASGTSVEVAIETLKPEFISYGSDEVSLGGEVVIQGSNLDLVVKATFTGGAEVEITNTNAEVLVFAMPTMKVETGTLILTMANGESVEIPRLTVNAPEFCYIPVLPSEDEELKGGEVFEIVVANGDKLTGVEVNNTTVQYIINGDKLYISIPQVAGKNTKIKLISSNGEIEYPIDFIPATEIENVVMNEMQDLGSWSNNFRLYKADLVNAGFAVGAKLRFYVKSYAYTQIQVNDANWGTITMPEYNSDECPSMIELDVTQEFYDRVMNTNDGWSDTGFVIQGAGCIINKVSVWYEISLETTIWSGPIEISWGNGGRVMLPASSFNGAKAGAKLRFYYDQKQDVWAQAQMNYGDWSALVFPEIGKQEMVPTDIYGWEFASRITEVTLTREILDNIQTKQGECEGQTNMGIIVQGSDLIFNKVTLE